MPFDNKKKRSQGRHFKPVELEKLTKTDEYQAASYKPLSTNKDTIKRPKTDPPVIKAPSKEMEGFDKPVFEKTSFSGPSRENSLHDADSIRKQQTAPSSTATKKTALPSKPSSDKLHSDGIQASETRLKTTIPHSAVDVDLEKTVGATSSKAMIKFEKVTKTYHLYKNDRGRFLGLFNYKKKANYLGSVSANKELSFEILKGEAVAFLGQNGAGKSTALKIVTGVARPTSGKVIVEGRVSAILELNAGFDSQLTGRENISLRGQALGLSRREISDLEPRIIDFAELGVYIDQPIRTYSSGMKSRLGFAFAVTIEPDIFVVDETLSVGDKNFKEKCITRIREIMRDRDVTVLFVTHSSDVAQEFCTRGIVLKEGRSVFDGLIGEAIRYYNKYC